MKRNIVILTFCLAISIFLSILKINSFINWEWIGVVLPFLISIFVLIVDLIVRGYEKRELNRRLENALKSKREIKKEIKNRKSVAYKSAVVVKVK